MFLNIPYKYFAKFITNPESTTKPDLQIMFLRKTVGKPKSGKAHFSWARLHFIVQDV